MIFLNVQVPVDTKSAGTSCDNMKGYCDAFSVCRRINMEGPLKRLFSKILSVEGVYVNSLRGTTINDSVEGLAVFQVKV